MEQKPDIFDRIMSWGIMRPFQPLYQKYKEPLLYLFFGGLTTLLSIVLFWLLTQPLHMGALIANVLGWIVCVAFAYATNRTWVFREKAQDLRGILREILSFFAGRLGTLGMEEVMLWLGIDLLGINSMTVKVVAQVFVIVGNYFISKWFVFTDSSQRA